MNALTANNGMQVVDAWFPPKLQPLFEPHRYKVMYGGRGAGRSWGCARALLILNSGGFQDEVPSRTLCARELQNSIRDSVHKLLSDQISLLQMNYLYEIQQAVILGRKGTQAEGAEFSFEGLRLNADKVKSFENVKRCWVEEAESTSKNSWDVLIPTIRADGSEIWVTYNPRLETDETHQRFVIKEHTNHDIVVIYMTYLDNERCSDLLRAEAEACRARDIDDYNWIWLGKCRQNLDGAVYAAEMRDATVQNRITRVPYDASRAVNVYFDLGRGDFTSMWFEQRSVFEHYMIDFYQDRGKLIDHFIEIMQRKGYTYDTIWLPHDARARSLGTKLTIEEQLRAKGYRVLIVPRLTLVDGINAARTVFPRVYFDQDHCADGLHSLRHYRYEVHTDPNDAKLLRYSEKPVHDWASDAADAFRYFAVSSKSGKRRHLDLSEKAKNNTGAEGFFDNFTSRIGDSLGWMR